MTYPGNQSTNRPWMVRVVDCLNQVVTWEPGEYGTGNNQRRPVVESGRGVMSHLGNLPSGLMFVFYVTVSAVLSRSGGCPSRVTRRCRRKQRGFLLPPQRVIFCGQSAKGIQHHPDVVFSRFTSSLANRKCPGLAGRQSIGSWPNQ
jgi:hypothetical protein